MYKDSNKYSSNQIKTCVSMETSSPAASQSSQSVEEEYTINVPLVRPKQGFHAILRLAGATADIFTKKEIIHYLKDYISSRQLYDVHNPSVVHCAADPLGQVFGVKSFTIDQVLTLLAKHCVELPDRCVRQKRRLVARPFSGHAPVNSLPGTVTIAVCHDTARCTGTLVTAASPIQPREGKSRGRHGASSPDADCDTEGGENVVGSKSEAPSSCREKDGAPEGAADTSSSEEGKRGKRKKRSKGGSDPECSSPRKRHHTEPSQSPSCPRLAGPGSSSRRRGASVSITYGGDGEEDGFPWYFQLEVGDQEEKSEVLSVQLEMGDQEDKSEVLSVQSKETVTVRDSTDDLWFLDDNVESDVEFSVEYDVESDVPEPTESDLSSVRSGEGLLLVCRESDVEFFADCSDSDSNTDDKELSEADNWVCHECQLSNPPYQRYCDRCWKLRSDWLPNAQSALDRDKNTSQLVLGLDKNTSQSALDLDKNTSQLVFGLDKSANDKTKEDSVVTDTQAAKTCEMLVDTSKISDTIDSGIGSLSSTQPSSQETGVASDSMLLSAKTLGLPTMSKLCSEQEPLEEKRYSFSAIQGTESDSGNLSSQRSSVTEDVNQNVKVTGGHPLDDPCMICLTKPKTASLIHGSSGHQVCCFACAKRLKRRGKVCPVCRRPIQKVVKNYIL